MVTGRIPGLYGFGYGVGCVYYHGPAGFHAGPYDEVPNSTLGPIGLDWEAFAAGADAGNLVDDPDKLDLERLVRLYGSIKDKSGKSFTYWAKRKLQHRVPDYVSYRTGFFGSEKSYREQLAAARAELDADGEKLRKFIEPDVVARKRHADWRLAQDVFYAWVRKAYQDELGVDVDIPKLIKSQMSEKLKTALAKVKVDYGKAFQFGGFNPRPMKRDGYLLGTISEHAIGTAVDVESEKNAHIDTPTWKAIQTFTGKTLTHATAQAKWKTAPKELVESFKAINDEFLARLAKAIEDTAEGARKAADAPGATKAAKARWATVKKDPLPTTIGDNESLKKIGRSFINEWGKKGFFDLPWELIKEFHEEGFLWGATFEHPDLHHFEL